MRVLLSTLLGLNLLIAGCIGGDEPIEGSATESVDAAPEEATEPVVQLFEGVATASALSPLAHQQATEPLLADLQREGAVIEVTQAPATARLEVAWTSPSPVAEMMLMVDLPVPGSEDLVTFLSGWSASSPLCMDIPVEHLAESEGDWSLMVHNRGAALLEFEMTLITVGGDVLLNTDRYHMEVEDEERVRDVLDGAPCEPSAEASRL